MGAPFPEALQYRVDAWSERGKPLFQLPVLKIHLIYSPRIGDVSDIKLIRTDFFLLGKILLTLNSCTFHIYIRFLSHRCILSNHIIDKCTL